MENVLLKLYRLDSDSVVSEEYVMLAYETNQDKKHVIDEFRTFYIEENDLSYISITEISLDGSKWLS